MVNKLPESPLSPIDKGLFSFFRQIFVLSLFVLTYLFTSSFITCCYAWQDKVVGISDGDTIIIMHEGKGEKIRIYGIDTPEMGQAYGRKAKQFTSQMVFGKIVEVKPVTKDKYGRTVGLVKITDMDLSEELVKAGFAWVYTKYCDAPKCRDWVVLEKNAKEKNIGLWSESNPVAPWEYRKSNIKRKTHGQR